MTRTQNRIRWWWVIMLVCPVVIGMAIFLGHGWNHPLQLLEQDGILAIRLWRVFSGVLVGAALSVAGVILQAVLKNPLAEPYVLGLSSGAGLGVAACIISGGMTISMYLLPLAGFAGAVISLLIVYRLARVGSVTLSHTLILSGVIWGALCGSILMFIVSRSSIAGLHAIMWWFLGDLQVYNTSLVVHGGVVIGVGCVVLAFFARDLNVLMLGEETAEHVGLSPERVKVVVLCIAALLTATAVSMSGLIGFVGLVVPHFIRALVGPEHRRLLPASAMAGAAFLVLADGLGRMLFFPVELPAGVLTSFIGAPFFLFILRRRQKDVWR